MSEGGEPSQGAPAARASMQQSYENQAHTEWLVRRGMQEAPEGDASTLDFGPAFDPETTIYLFLGEVALLLQQQEEQRRGSQEELISPIFDMCLKHSWRFRSVKDQDSAIAIRNILMREQLHPFELAQIATLAPSDYEEAVTLIPSIADRMDEDKLNNMLHDLEQYFSDPKMYH